tara:strand:+ start:348 stop:518 length:171 start_codon:yes stop_codon:yes gene_type:complete
MSKEKGRQWDGRSRISNDTYRKNFDEIFKKQKEKIKQANIQSDNVDMERLKREIEK